MLVLQISDEAEQQPSGVWNCLRCGTTGYDSLAFVFGTALSIGERGPECSLFIIEPRERRLPRLNGALEFELLRALAENV